MSDNKVKYGVERGWALQLLAKGLLTEQEFRALDNRLVRKYRISRV